MKPKKDSAVKYSPPNGRARNAQFVRSVKTESGEWWELRESKQPRSPTFRARPGNCKFRQ